MDGHMDEAVIAILRSCSSNKDRISQYICRLQEEEITSMEDLADLDSSFLIQTIRMTKLHAQKVARKCQRVTLKIAVGMDDNIIGCVRVFRGTTIHWLRKSIETDGLPVEESFVFLTHGTEITGAQEDLWDVEQLTANCQTGVVVIKYKDAVEPLFDHQSSRPTLNFEARPFIPPEQHPHQKSAFPSTHSPPLSTTSNTFPTQSAFTFQYDSPGSSFSGKSPMWKNTTTSHSYTDPPKDDHSTHSYSDRQSSSPPIFTDVLPDIADNFTDLDIQDTVDFSTSPFSKASDSNPDNSVGLQVDQLSNDSPFQLFPEYESPLSGYSDKPFVESKDSVNLWSIGGSKFTRKSFPEETGSNGRGSWHWSNSEIDVEAGGSSAKVWSDNVDDFDSADDSEVQELSQQLKETLDGSDPTGQQIEYKDGFHGDNDESPFFKNSGISQIWISNLDGTVSTDNVLAVAETCGRVRGIQRKAVSYAFVAYNSPSIATSAVAKLDGQMFEGRRIRVKLAKYNSQDLDKGGELSSIRSTSTSHSQQQMSSPSVSSQVQTGSTYQVSTSRLVLSNLNPQTTTERMKQLTATYGYVIKIVRNNERRLTVFYRDAFEAKRAANALNGHVIEHQVVTAQQVVEDVSVNVPAVKARTAPLQPPLLPLPHTSTINPDGLATIKKTVVSLKDALLDQQYVKRLLSSLIVDESSMAAFCTFIVHEAVHHSTEYTKVCRRLDSLSFQVVIPGRNLGLKRVLLTQCQKFFQQTLEQVKATQGHLSGRVFDHEIGVVIRSQSFVQLRGLLRFLAELYMQRFIPGSILFNCVDVLLEGAHLCCLLNVHALLVNVGRYLCQENMEKMDKCFSIVEEMSRKYVLPDKVKGLMQDLCERRKFKFSKASVKGAPS